MLVNIPYMEHMGMRWDRATFDGSRVLFFLFFTVKLEVLKQQQSVKQIFKLYVIAF